MVRWSHAEAMKKSPARGVGAAVARGGGWKRGVLGPGKAELGGPSCGSGGSWTSWSEAAAPAKEAGTATCRGKGVQMWEWDWTEPDAKKARPCDAGRGEAGRDEEEELVYEWRWTEAVSPEILALVFRGRLAADEVARGAEAGRGVAGHVGRRGHRGVVPPRQLPRQGRRRRAPARRPRAGHAPEALRLPRRRRLAHLRRSLVSHAVITDAWSELILKWSFLAWEKSC